MTHLTRLSFFITAILLLTARAPRAAEVPADTAKSSSLDQLQNRFQSGLDAVRSKHDLPGLTAAYALPDGRILAFATGLADKEAGAKMTPDSRMPAGSIGKMFVAATALGLSLEGKLSLDDRIEKWLGTEPWFSDLPNAHEITLRHLLMHRSGLADHIYDPKWGAAARRMVSNLDKSPDTYFTPAENIQFILKRDPLCRPGQEFHYTDTGYIVLGLVIERAGKATYYDQVRERFLTPLQLKLTEPANHRDIAGLAAGYLAPENPFGLPAKITRDGTLCYNPATEWTGGGLVSNPQDLVRWAKALFEGKALSRPYLDQLLAADLSDKDKPHKYALGVSMNHDDLGASYGHGGWSVGYLSHLEYFPAQSVAVAVQVNTDARDNLLPDVRALIREVLEAVGSSVPH